MYQYASIILLILNIFSCKNQQSEIQNKSKITTEMNDNNTEKAILANGCFWCTEAIFQSLNGVLSVKPGYIGGIVENPTYEEVCTGNTNHAEALEIIFDPKIIKYEELLEVFFATHDPTTLNRQGNDIGTQYRSEIFYLNDSQKDIANQYIKQLTNAQTWPNPIVTKVTKATTFYLAEDYHQNYYNQNADKNPYCTHVVRPKVEKFKKQFQSKIKP